MMTYNHVRVLVAVDLLQDNSYGTNVASQIAGRRKMNRSFQALIYLTLGRLHRRGYLNKWVNVERRPYGKKLRVSRPFYSLTKEGRAALKEAVKEMDRTLGTWRKGCSA